MQEPKPFSAESERLYDEYLRDGARGSWQAWLLAHEDRLADAPAEMPMEDAYRRILEALDQVAHVEAREDGKLEITFRSFPGSEFVLTVARK